MKYTREDIVTMFKALSNDTRIQIMQWLSKSDSAFAGVEQHEHGGIPGWGGACVSTIQKKAGVSQSVVSTYLRIMTQAGLLESKRYEKWTYYRINREAAEALADYVYGWTK